MMKTDQGEFDNKMNDLSLECAAFDQNVDFENFEEIAK